MSSKDDQCFDTILGYLIKQNRPYSAIDVQTNLHNEFGKSAVNRALERLSSSGQVRIKTYNKQNVYVAEQSQYPSLSDAELKALDIKILALTERIKTLNEECKSLETAVHRFNVEVTNEEAEAELLVLEKESTDLNNRLSFLVSKTVVLSQKEKIVINNRHVSHNKEWRNRKRMCNEMINAVLENYPESKRALLDETNIETDEDFGMSNM